MAKKIEGYIHCTEKGCPRRDIRTYLYTRKEVDSYFPPKGQIPNCPVCGRGMALWSKQTQENFDRIFHL
jgi:hypothetical protein